MKKQKLSLLKLCLMMMLAVGVFAQGASQISGKVTDAATGDVLIGANVQLIDTQLGASCDLEGNFAVKNVPPGTYNLRVTYVGYSTKVVNNLVVETGKPTKIDIALNEELIQGQEVVVEATAILSSENALLVQQRKAATISDAVAADQIKRAPDATTGDALRRVTGVAIVDNKYVYVRGTGERYSNTLLNGAQLSSTEPDKKSYAFDMLPSNLLENTVISKSFTPDLPGNFSGGLVQINTIEFPDQLTIRASVGGSYNTNSTSRGFKTYEGSKYDYLAIDDGTRDLPSLVNGRKVTSSNYSASDLQAIGRSFSNIWSPSSQKAVPNSSYMLSIGGSSNLFGRKLGYIGALSYRNSYDRVEIKRSDFNADGTPQFDFTGEENSFSVLWGGLMNVSYQVADFHKISFKNLYNRTGDDEVIELSGNNFDSGTEQRNTGLHYVERSSYNGQLIGEHAFPSIAGLQAQWRASYSTAKREEPDYRRLVYQRGMGTSDQFAANVLSAPDPGYSGRFFSDMTDDVRSAGLDLSLPVGGAKIKFGGLHNTSERDFAARVFAYKTTRTTDPRLVYSEIDTLFAPNHIGGAKGFQIEEATKQSDAYDASEKLYAGYLMIDLPFRMWNKNLRLIAGTRVESNEQRLDSYDQQSRPVHVDLDKTDILPAVNFTYSITEATNVRAAFSQTVSRPEFRELAPFAFFDFSTYSVIYGDPTLRRALIKNFDLRFETFPNVGEVFSASLFYKNFTDAIEEVIVPGGELIRSYANADKARNYGIEIEMRKSLRFIGNTFSNFSMTANYALIDSKVDLESANRAVVAKKGRRLQGQSPYTVNLGLLYTNERLGNSVSLLYNRFGERISQVGSLFDGDVMEQPRNLFDLTVAQNFWEKYEIKFAVKDVLGKEQVFTQDGQQVKGNHKGTTYSMGVSVKL